MNFKKYTLTLALLLALQNQLVPSPGMYGDPVALLRAGRWEDVLQFFRIQKPSALQQKYIHARAVEEDGDKYRRNNGEEILIHYLYVLNVDCKNAKTEDDFVQCLSGLQDESLKNLHEQLAAYHAANIAASKKWEKLRFNLLRLSSLRQNDPLSRDIYSDLMTTMMNLGMNERAGKLAAGYKNLSSPVINMRRASIFYRNGYKTESLEFYLNAASSTSTPWILKSVYTNVRNNFPDIFTPASSPQRIQRYLVCFSQFMSAAELNSMKNIIPQNVLISTSGQETILHDGIFLIKTNQSEFLNNLSEKNYTYLSLNPDILRIWLETMNPGKDSARASSLMKTFEHTKINKASLWRAHLEILEKSKNPDIYYSELIAYLKKNHSDYRIADKLIEFLIGNDTGKIKWAADRYWIQAKSELSEQTGSGRFIYWLKRYYEYRKDTASLKEIQENFYRLSPGSYYARSFWDESKASGYAADWYKVYDRNSYLQWISKYGGNDAALRFLSDKYTEPYRDINSVKLAGYLKNINYTVPYEIIELYTLGEFNLAENFYADYYADKISYTENLLRKYYLGKITGNLHMSTYYMRSLLREYNIPEDPFSLHPYILQELYPRPYLSSVQKYSKIYGIDENMVYGLMRQESMFRETSVSSSGAIGLMQIMPRTGKWLAGLMKINNPDLMKPETSIQMGAKFFADLIRHYGNDFRWASIAYNGGPGNLSKWKKNHYHGDFNLFLEQLPVEEPRNYCRFTYQNYNHYKITYTLYP